MRYWVVFDYGHYLEPYGNYATEQEAQSFMFRAKRCRPDTKIRVVQA